MIRLRRRAGGIPTGVLATSASVTAEAAARAAADLLLASKSKTINTQTGDYTLALGDADAVVEMNKATANTLTVPPNSSVAFPTGTQIKVVQLGAGLTTIAAGAGVTIRSTSGVLALAGQYDQTTLIKRGTNEWEMAPTHAAYATVGDGASAGASATSAVLKSWTSGECYELTALTRNAQEVVTSATVKWPDGSGGTFTATTVNATWNAVDAFTISHTLSGKTVTQAAVTRDSGGGVTTKPALTVA